MLSRREQRFVVEYIVDGNATQAAIRAGYSARTARSIGSENLTKPDIAAAVRQALGEVAAATIADAKERRETLTGMLRDADAHPLARLKAADILNKMDGLYVLKHAGADGGPLVLTWEQ